MSRALLLSCVLLAPASAFAQWNWLVVDYEYEISQAAYSNSDAPLPYFDPITQEPVAVYNPGGGGGNVFSPDIYQQTFGLQPTGAELVYGASNSDRPARSPWTATMALAEDGRFVTRVDFSSSFLAGFVDEISESTEYTAPRYSLSSVLHYKPTVPTKLLGREGVLGVMTGVQVSLNYSFHLSDVESGAYSGNPIGSMIIGPGGRALIEEAYDPSGAFGSTNNFGTREETLVQSNSSPLAAVEGSNGSVFYRNFGDGGLIVTDSLGMNVASFAVDLSALYFGASLPVGLHREATIITETQFDFHWLGLDVETLIWNGSASSNFLNAANWSSPFTPGIGDTVELSSLSPKTIQFDAGDFVQISKLVAKPGSETRVDLNNGVWRIDPGTTAGATDGQVRIAGATLEVTDGTLEVFGNVVLMNDGATSALLELSEGGKLVVQGNDFIAGRGVGSHGASMQVDGLGSLLEARAIVLGEVAGAFTGLVSGGGRMVAGQAMVVGGNAAATLLFTGNSNPNDPVNTASRLTISEGGTLEIGLQANGTLAFSNGAIAQLTGVAVTVGPNAANGRLAVSGSSLLVGNRVNLGAKGLFEVKQSQAEVRRLEVDGGVVDVQSEGQILLGEDLSLFGGALLAVDGDSLVRTPTLFTASSRIHLTGNSTLQVPGEDGTTLFPIDGTKTARMLGGTLLIEQGSVFQTPVFALQAGTVTGRGTIRGIVVNTGGRILPGASPGILTIDGDYLQEGGTLVMEIGGLNAGNDYDQLIVTGNFLLDGGEIEFAFINGFAPQAGQTFSFFQTGGSFANSSSFTVSGLEPGWEFETAFDPETGAFALTSLNDAVAIPEPSILVLLCLALGFLAVVRRRASIFGSPRSGN